MTLSFSREQLLSPLQRVIGAIEKRQTMPILSNVLLHSHNGLLHLTGTDLEIELVAKTDIEFDSKKDITLPARKLLDICKNLPEGADIKLSYSSNRVTLTSARSRFTLSTLPAKDYPVLEDVQFDVSFELARNVFKAILDKTGFSMAQQDVRYYLNGLLLECSNERLRAVATDGHRLALADAEAIADLPDKQVIVPRKAVIELQRLLGDTDEGVEISFSTNHIRVNFADLRFTSKLIDGRFPDYARVMPANGDKIMNASRVALSQSLTRTSILSNEKYRGVRLGIDNGLLKIQAQNPEKEEAEEELEVDYDGEFIEVAFNVNYILDVLNVVTADNVRVILKDSNSSCIIQDEQKTDTQYVIMPMRL